MAEEEIGERDRPKPAPVKAQVQLATVFENNDLADLCAASLAAIRNGGGFGWIEPPDEQLLAQHWRGVLLMPGRELFVGRLDGKIVGAVILVQPARNNEAQSFATSLVSCFVAPWARNLGIARALVEALEIRARDLGFELVNLDLRETQRAALRLFEEMGYRQWGDHPYYAKVGGRFVRGLHYFKFIDPTAEPALPYDANKKMKQRSQRSQGPDRLQGADRPKRGGAW